MLLDRIHRVVGRGAVLVDAGNSAVTDGAAIVPGYGSACGYRLERWCFLVRHNGSSSFDKSALCAAAGGTGGDSAGSLFVQLSDYGERSTVKDSAPSAVAGHGD